ncbi:MAG: hypothetical protein EXR65_02930 [Dehalococcoidia bacterium]|nr:hypothetical protein [Dehalococcoidia bacterium]
MPKVQFAIWFYFGVLASWKWPRKTGLMRRQVVDARAADAVATQLMQYGRAIGMSDPALGAQLIADAFRDRDWVAPLEDLAELFERQHAAGGWLSLAEIDRNVPREFLTGEQGQRAVVVSFLAEVWFGSVNASDVRAELDSRLAGHQEWAAIWARNGAVTDAPLSIPESAAALAELASDAVREFELEQGPFDLAPASLTTLIAARRN